MDVSLYNPRIGFEIECVTHEDRHYELLRNMCEELGLPRQRVGADPYTGWRQVRDRSINYGVYQAGLEMVSPIMPYREGMMTMKIVFEWMIANKVYTNGTCGFHVGLSVDGMDKLDPVKMVMLFDEDSVLTMFDRTNNLYCHPLVPILRSNAEYRNGTFSRADAKGILTSRSRDTKYRSINFLKLQVDDPYLEFRCMGGKNYEQRYEEIELCVDHMVECMIFATQDHLMRHETDSSWENITRLST